VRFGAATPRKLKIMPLGDSITDGFNAYPGAYRPALWKKLVTTDGYELDYVGSLRNGDSSLPDKDHDGHSGWRIDEINGSIGGWLNTYDPDVILLHIGTNDIFQDASASVMTSRLDTLLNTIFSRKPDVTILVASLIPLRDNGTWNGQVWQQFNQSVPGTVNKYKNQGREVIFVDMATRSGLTQGSPDLPDGVHPSASGHAKMADVWYPAVKPLFSAP
jgi:lysophospholipase L1-like esterase